MEKGTEIKVLTDLVYSFYSSPFLYWPDIMTGNGKNKVRKKVYKQQYMKNILHKELHEKTEHIKYVLFKNILSH